MDDFINIKGGKELNELLQTLPVKLEKNILRGAMRAAAKVIAEEAKLNVPIQSGDLRNSIRVSTKSSKGKVIASVKAGNKKIYYANFVEFGTAQHAISARKGFLNIGGIFAKSVYNPGARAKPFLRPALDSKASKAIELAGEYIGKRLTKQGLNAPSIEVDDER